MHKKCFVTKTEFLLKHIPAVCQISGLNNELVGTNTLRHVGRKRMKSLARHTINELSVPTKTRGKSRTDSSRVISVSALPRQLLVSFGF